MTQTLIVFCRIAAVSYCARTAYSEAFPANGRVEFSVSVEDYNWQGTPAQNASSVYDLNNVSVMKAGFESLHATGVVKRARPISDPDLDSEFKTPFIVCILKDANGKLVGGFEGEAPKTLKLGESVAFDISTYDVPDYATAEVYAY